MRKRERKKFRKRERKKFRERGRKWERKENLVIQIIIDTTPSLFKHCCVWAKDEEKKWEHNQLSPHFFPLSHFLFSLTFFFLTHFIFNTMPRMEIDGCKKRESMNRRSKVSNREKSIKVPKGLKGNTRMMVTHIWFQQQEELLMILSPGYRNLVHPRIFWERKKRKREERGRERRKKREEKGRR